MTKQVVFIGAGNMGKSLIGGLLANGMAASNIGFMERLPEKIAAVEAEFGIQAVTELSQLCEWQAVVLAIKPQMLSELLGNMSQALSTSQQHPLWISIAAGFSAAQIARELQQPDAAIIRAMPNTPALVQAGATGLYANATVSDSQRQLAEQLFSAVGYATWVDDEAALHTVTAAAGSASAYYFYLMNAMCEEAVNMGLTPQQARELVLQTCFGAAKMAKASSEPLSTLQKNVMSKGGVTEAAIQCMETAKIDTLMQQTMRAARQRSLEMTAQFEQSE